MLILRLFLIVLTGFASHRAQRVTMIFGTRWGQLVRYAIGVLILIPSYIVLKAGFPQPQKRFGEVERDIASLLLAAGGIGTGVLIGYVVDNEEDVRNDRA